MENMYGKVIHKNDWQRFHCSHFSCFWNSTTSEVNSTDHHYTDSSEESLGMHQQISSYDSSYQRERYHIKTGMGVIHNADYKIAKNVLWCTLNLFTMENICNMSHWQFPILTLKISIESSWVTQTSTFTTMHSRFYHQPIQRTVLHTRRSQVWLLILSFHIFHWLNPTGHSMVLGSTQPLCLLRRKGSQCKQLITLPPLCVNYLKFSGASNSWIPKGLPSSVKRYLYLTCLKIWMSLVFQWKSPTMNFNKISGKS
jgi:hypothetical protein